MLFYFIRRIETVDQKLELIGVSSGVSKSLNNIADFILFYNEGAPPQLTKCRYQAGPLAFNAKEMELAVNEYIEYVRKMDKEVRENFGKVWFRG
jgi:hypothetical protein